MSSKRSPKGMPEPHQLSDGTWEVRFRYTLVPHGKQYSIRFRDKKKSEVIKQLKAFDPHKDHVKRGKDNHITGFISFFIRLFAGCSSICCPPYA